MSTSLPDILLYIAIPLIGMHFYLFNKTLKTIDSEERDRYVNLGGSKYNILSTVFLFGGLLYFDGFETKLIFSVLIILSTIIGTIVHHKKLRALNFDTAFEKRLLNISYISGVGIILVLCSLVLSVQPT